MASRSSQWFSRDDIYGFIYRSWTKTVSILHDQFDGVPSSGSAHAVRVDPCNSHFRLLADQFVRACLRRWVSAGVSGHVSGAIAA